MNNFYHMKMAINMVNSLQLRMLFLTVISLCYYSSAYPNGPPVSVCRDGLPVHMKDGKVVPPQMLPSPYMIEVNATTYKPGDNINVKITSYVGQAFRGLFAQVVPIPHGANDSIKYSPAGLYERNLKNIKLFTCRYMLDTLTHKDRFMKFEASFKWRSPLIMKHDVVVRATILKDFDVYWHNVESTVIKLKYEGTLPAETLEKPWLEEIIKTVKASDDTETRRKLTRERFNKGFQNALTPDGNIMVNYVTNILPYKDSPVPGFAATANKVVSTTENMDDNEVNKTNNFEDPANSTNNTTDEAEVTSTPAVQNNTNDNNATDLSDPMAVTDAIIKKKEPLPKQTMQKFYEVLVEALLNDNKEVADALHDLISEKTP